MKLFHLAIVSLAVGLAAMQAVAQAPEEVGEARIPFADHGGIRNFRVVGDSTVFIEATGGKWYRAELMTPCQDLRFRDALGFESNADGSFDKFSTIRSRGRACPVQSLTLSGPPPKKRG